MSHLHQTKVGQHSPLGAPLRNLHLRQTRLDLRRFLVSPLFKQTLRRLVVNLRSREHTPPYTIRFHTRHVKNHVRASNSLSVS